MGKGLLILLVAPEISGLWCLEECFFFFFVPGLYRRHCMNMHVYHSVPFISEIFYGYGNMTQDEAGSKLSLAMF